MPRMQQPIDSGNHPRHEDGGGDRLSEASVSGVPSSVRDGATGAGDGSADGERPGVSDPALPLLRSDYERNWSAKPGYEGTNGFAKYLRAHGIISDWRWRSLHGCVRSRIHDERKEECDCRYELTGLDIDTLR